MKMTGYILPVAMSIMSVLTFTMLGVMETSQVEEKRARNEQSRRIVEQVSKSELIYQSKFIESNPNLLRKSSDTSLSPITFKTGCTSTSKDAVCQTVKLKYLSAIPKPPRIQSTVPYSKFTGRRFKLTSQAQNRNSGVSAEMSTEMSSVQLDLLARQDVSHELFLNPDRDKLISEIGYFVPAWWDVTIKSPWRFGCIGPNWSISPLIFLGAWGALADILNNKNISFIAKCHVTYTDKNGVFRHWASEDINPGDKVSFTVPADSSGVTFYWRGIVWAATADVDDFWDRAKIWPEWWRFRQYTWGFPTPRDFCSVIHGTALSAGSTECPFELLDGIAPIIGAG